MARQGNLNIMGSVRVVQTDGDPDTSLFVALTNNGAFSAIASIGLGACVITMDDDYQLSDGDVVDAQVEEAAVGIASVERLSQTQVRVRIFTAAGVAAALPFGLVVTRRYYQ